MQRSWVLAQEALFVLKPLAQGVWACSGNFTSPTAWMIDLLNFALGFCPLVRSRVSSPSTLGHQLLLASNSARFLFAATRSDKYGVYNHGCINSFIIDRIAFLSIDMTITGKLKSVGCRRSARVVLVDFPG